MLGYRDEMVHPAVAVPDRRRESTADVSQQLAEYFPADDICVNRFERSFQGFPLPIYFRSEPRPLVNGNLHISH